MRIIVSKQLLNAILRWLQGGLLACAAAMLGYCAFVLMDTRVFQERESHNFQRHLEDQNSKSGDLPRAKAVSPAKTLPVPEMRGVIGRIEIARLGLSVIVIEGDDSP